MSLHEVHLSSKSVPKHSTLWFEDGSLEIVLGDEVRINVHRSILIRLSPFFAQEIDKITNNSPIYLPARYLEGLYHILSQLYFISPPLCEATPLDHILKIMVATSEPALHFPTLYAHAKRYFDLMYPTDRYPVDYKSWSHLRTATKICMRLQLRDKLKGFFYALITVSEFEAPLRPSMMMDDSEESLITQRCICGMRAIVDHFTPILFTPPATLHMQCTDHLAENWMPLVLTPALKEGGVYKPLETLDNIRNIDWEGVGVCSDCVVLKNKEWQREADIIWEKLDEWLSLPNAK